MTPHPGSNAQAFESTERVAAYNALPGLTAAEELLVERWIGVGAAVLDLGVGTGRTVPALRAKASRYVGLDYSQAMVSAAAERFPDAEIVHGDAADLRDFADDSFDAVVFSYNGLDYLTPLDRRAKALAEILRVLRPDGVFIMSTHNPRALLRRPRAEGGHLRAIAMAAAMTIKAIRARGLASATLSGSGYHADHVQGLETYFATPGLLLEEMRHAGFAVADVVGADHPEPLCEMRTPWTYIAALPRPSGLEVTVEEFPAVGTDLASQWDDVIHRVGVSPFQGRTWVTAWREALEPSASVKVLVARQGHGVVGVMPVARLRRDLHRRLPFPLTYVGIAGSGPGAADHLGPAAINPAVAAVLVEALVEIFGDRTILAESIAPDLAPIVAANLGGQVVRQIPCPVNTRAPDGSFRESWSAKARKNARRRSRLLVDEGITARWTGPGADFTPTLRVLRQLHGERWAARGQAGLFPQERENLLSRFAAQSSPGQGPMILTLERGGRPVAALLGVRFRDSFSVYKTGWSPDGARLGLGIALGQEAMRWAEDQGLITFDYLRGPGGHKAELGCVPRHDLSVLRPVGLVGALLRVREDASHRLRLAARRLRRRSGSP